MFAITEVVRRRAPYHISAAALADEFDVTRRTIERDLASLRQAGVALEPVIGRGGGQLLTASSRGVVLMLSDEEVTALLLAVTASGGMPFGTAGRTATARLLDALPPATRIGVDELRAKVRTTVGDRPMVDGRVRRTLEETVRRSTVVNIVYCDRNDAVTERAVEAVGFYGAADGWYLIGWCRLRKAGRIFRLDRIQRARATRQKNPPRDVDETLGWVPGELLTPGSAPAAGPTGNAG
jgi:predicted DNA-binding transcriptional regulator YafY